jgi:hypothetical protein
MQYLYKMIYYFWQLDMLLAQKRRKLKAKGMRQGCDCHMHVDGRHVVGQGGQRFH